MPFLHLGFHTLDKQNAPFPSISDRLRMRAYFPVPGDGNGVQADFLGAIDLFKNRVLEVSINRITLAVTMKFDAIGGHGLIMEAEHLLGKGGPSTGPDIALSSNFLAEDGSLK